MTTTLDITSIILESKKDFTRDKKSIIKDYLKNNNNDVVITYVNKKRGSSIKLYTIKNDTIKTYDYVIKNALIVIDALIKNGVTIKQYDKVNNAIIDYIKK